MNWSGPSGVVSGALALIALEAVTKASSDSASGASRLLSLAKYPGQLAAAWMSPTTPLIPDLAAGKTTAAAAATTTASSMQLATLAQPT